jgi:SAM-dependent methyltransferase
MVRVQVLASLFAVLCLGLLGCSPPATNDKSQVAAANESESAPAESGTESQDQDKPEREPDVPYVPTPDNVVKAMLDLAQLKKGEKMYDLGSGDGRIVIAAARDFGAKGTGVDINPKLVAESRENAKKAGVEDRANFLVGDLFKMNFADADVVTMYLLPSINLQLRPQLFEQLRPGVRVVSHAFDMGDWRPDETVVTKPDERTIYLWIMPAKVEGSWTWGRTVLRLSQKFQDIRGELTVNGNKGEVNDLKLRGTEISFRIGRVSYQGKVIGNNIVGTESAQGQLSMAWEATKK